MIAKLGEFIRCARALGATPGGQAAILWRLSKNFRVRLGLARYHPEQVYALQTRLGTIYLRDNFGDVTNLPGLLVDNEYRVDVLAGDGAVLDIGANIGLFSRFAQSRNPGRAVHAFEPLPGNAEMVRRNCPGAVVNCVGVGKESAALRLGVDPHGIMATAIEQKWETEASEFRVVPLDGYVAEHGIARVAMMKIDTEGMELDVLDGAPETLRKTDRVAIETHGPDRHAGTIARLEKAGFRIDDQFRNGGTGAVFASRKNQEVTESDRK